MGVDLLKHKRPTFGEKVCFWLLLLLLLLFRQPAVRGLFLRDAGADCKVTSVPCDLDECREPVGDVNR